AKEESTLPPALFESPREPRGAARLLRAMRVRVRRSWRANPNRGRCGARLDARIPPCKTDDELARARRLARSARRPLESSPARARRGAQAIRRDRTRPRECRLASTGDREEMRRPLAA